MPDSSTGGYLLPVAGGPAPLQGQALLRAIGLWVSSLTGLDGTLVRPRWQSEPPAIPPHPSAWTPASGLPPATAWADIAVYARPAPGWPVIRHDDANGVDHLYRFETLEITARFYDVGYDGGTDELASRLRDGSAIDQNLEGLALQGIFLKMMGTPRPVPLLKNDRWLYQVDLPFELTRTSTRDYAILSIEEVAATIVVEDAGGTKTDFTIDILTNS
jgi:hypothetical protein